MVVKVFLIIGKIDNLNINEIEFFFLFQFIKQNEFHCFKTNIVFLKKKKVMCKQRKKKILEILYFFKIFCIY